MEPKKTRLCKDFSPRPRAGRTPARVAFLLVLLSLVLSACKDPFAQLYMRLFISPYQTKFDPEAFETLKGFTASTWTLEQTVEPGQSCFRTLAGLLADKEGSTITQVQYRWTPPEGVKPTDIKFIGRQPDRRLEDGTYVFDNVPVDEDGYFEEVKAEFPAPSLPPGKTRLEMVDTLQVVSPSLEKETDTTHQVVIALDVQARPAHVSSTASTWLPASPTQTAGPSTEADDYYVWALPFHFSDQEPLTTSRCQEWMDVLQSDSSFIALRFPDLPPTSTYTASSDMPVVFHAAYFPTLRLVQKGTWPQPDTVVFTTSLDYKPAHFTFLENELPAAEHERWLALGVVSTPTVTCPAELALDSGEWEFVFDVWLDFGGAKDACLECVLPFYYCYEGQATPSATGLGRLMQDVGLTGTAYQSWNRTCLGPQPLRLVDWDAPVDNMSPPFVLEGMNTAHVSPTQTISLSHYISNEGFESVTVTLDYSSTLGLPWGIYSGTEEGPDFPLIEISQPLTLGAWSASTRYLWMIAEVPTGTQGAETLVLTATDVTSPTQFAWASDLVWIGEWIAPPPSPFEQSHRIYLPLVLRQAP